MITAAWMVGVISTAVYGLLLKIAPSVGRDAAIVYAVLLVTAWAFLFVTAERTRRARRRR